MTSNRIASGSDRGKLIILGRRLARIDRSELARRVGSTVGRVRALERGLQPGRLFIYARCCYALDMDLDAFVFGEMRFRKWPAEPNRDYPRSMQFELRSSDLSLRELAKAAGITRGVTERLSVNPQKDFRCDIAAKILKALGVSFMDIVMRPTHVLAM